VSIKRTPKIIKGERLQQTGRVKQKKVNFTIIFLVVCEAFKITRMICGFFVTEEKKIAKNVTFR
jgi:hypothetical protein